MSRPVSRVEAICREYDCPRCGSGLGAQCRSRSGRWIAYSHAARWYVAQQDGRFGRDPR